MKESTVGRTYGKKAARGSGESRAGASPARNEAMEWVKSIAIALVLFVVLRVFLIQAYTIPSGSMEKTLLVGDYLMANNAIFGAHIPFTQVHTPAFRDPQHGDIVVFRPTYNQPMIDVVKRVIGEPGDTLQMKAGVVYRNGKALEEPYVLPAVTPDRPIEWTGEAAQLPPEVKPGRYGYHNQVAALLPSVDRATYHPTRDNWGPLVVPPHDYWVMGDNRGESLDSRFMGFIPRDEIRAKAMFIYFSVDKQSDRPFPKFITAARWGRIGRIIH